MEWRLWHFFYFSPSETNHISGHGMIHCHSVQTKHERFTIENCSTKCVSQTPSLFQLSRYVVIKRLCVATDVNLIVFMAPISNESYARCGNTSQVFCTEFKYHRCDPVASSPIRSDMKPLAPIIAEYRWRDDGDGADTCVVNPRRRDSHNLSQSYITLLDGYCVAIFRHIFLRVGNHSTRIRGMVLIQHLRLQSKSIELIAVNLKVPVLHFAGQTQMQISAQQQT